MYLLLYMLFHAHRTKTLQFLLDTGCNLKTAWEHMALQAAIIDERRLLQTEFVVKSIGQKVPIRSSYFTNTV